MATEKAAQKPAQKPLSKKAAAELAKFQIGLLMTDPAKLDQAKLLEIITKIVLSLLGGGVPWDVIVDILNKRKLPVPAELKPKS